MLHDEVVFASTRFALEGMATRASHYISKNPESVQTDRSLDQVLACDMVYVYTGLSGDHLHHEGRIDSGGGVAVVDEILPAGEEAFGWNHSCEVRNANVSPRACLEEHHGQREHIVEKEASQGADQQEEGDATSIANHAGSWRSVSFAACRTMQVYFV